MAGGKASTYENDWLKLLFNAVAIANIADNASIALNFNSTAEGGDVAVFTAQASVDDNGPTAAEWDAYVAKYGAAIRGLEMTPDSFRADYSVTIRVEPQRVRGW